MDERLQKILSRWGVASRRQAEAMILEGRVLLNGQVAELGQRADLDQDVVCVDGQPLGRSQRPASQYILLNKPTGVVSTCHDPRGRKTVLDLLPPFLKTSQGLHPVGRLDASSTGALLLTNDGQFTFRLTHPSHRIAKIYRVTVEGHPSTSALKSWRSGVSLGGQLTQPATVKQLQRRATTTVLEVTLREGRNRQIRRVAEQLGHPVQQLHRCSIGPIKLGDLASAHSRDLTVGELQSLEIMFEAKPLLL